MVQFEKVYKLFPGSSFGLENITFTIKEKEFVSLVGPSGAGKTTVLKLLLAEERPTSGTIFFDGLDVHALGRSDVPRYRRRIGMVFQDFRLLPYKTAYENSAFAMEAAGKTEEEIETDVPQVLDLVNLIEKSWHFPHELSGGEKQRVAIARAIINQPDVVIADEPTGNLDPLNTWDIVKILEKINELGTTVILATHDKSIIDSLGRRVIAMENGRLVRDDKKGKYVI